jgi:hypothetical protein
MVMRATLESTTDGILVTDEKLEVIDSNAKYIDMWKIPQGVMQAGLFGDWPNQSKPCAQLGRRNDANRSFCQKVGRMSQVFQVQTTDRFEVEKGTKRKPAHHPVPLLPSVQILLFPSVLRIFAVFCRIGEKADEVAC